MTIELRQWSSCKEMVFVCVIWSFDDMGLGEQVILSDKGNRETDLRKGNSSGISSFQSGQIAVLIDELYHNLCDRPQPTEKIPQRITNVKEELRQPIQEPDNRLHLYSKGVSPNFRLKAVEK